MNPDRLAELEEQRTFLLRSLTDLDREHSAGDVDDADYLTLKDDYTARAAAVLRAIEAGRAALPTRRRTSPAKLASGLLASALLGVAIFWALTRSVSDDDSPDAPAPSAVALCPPTTTDVNTLLVDGRTALGTDPPCALELFRRVLDIEPENVEATTYLGWVIAFDAMSSGMQGPELEERGTLALQLVDRARTLDPDYPDAQCFTAIIRFRLLGDAEGAKDPLDRCRAGELPAEVAPLVEQLGARIDAELEAATSSSP